MAVSVRDVARRRLGLVGAFSVTSDLYGYIYRDADGSVFGTLASSDLLPGSNRPVTRSLLRHLQTIDGTAFDMVLILVDHEDDYTGSVTLDQVTKVQYAVQVTRDLYAQGSVGVRRLVWQRIPQASAGGFAAIADRAEAKSLSDDWNGPGGGVDVFLVQSIGDADGWSNTPGPCDKNDTTDLSGAVLEVSGQRHITGILMAHEVGHYLGLGHTTSVANVMGDDSDGDGIGAIDDTSLALSASEGATMRTHCSMS